MKYAPRAYWSLTHDWDSQSVTADAVVEEDRTPQNTGILDQHGTPIYRQHETVPFGFRGKTKA